MRTLKSIFFVLIAFILLIILGPIAFIANLIFRKNKADYLFNIAIGIDQLGGSILYNQPDWTVSGWTYHQFNKTGHLEYYIFMRLIDFFFGKDHCKEAYYNELSLFKHYVEKD